MRKDLHEMNRRSWNAATESTPEIPLMYGLVAEKAAQ